MKQLVEALGDNALERYCTSGHLDEETVAKIEGVAGCLAFDADEDEPEDDDMSDGNGDEGADGSDGDDFQITDENASEPDE